MIDPVRYTVADLAAQPGSQVRGYCTVSLGTTTVALPIAITHGTEPGPFASVQARSQRSELGHVSQITDGAGLP
jgi:hypothetical protein